MIPVEFRGDLWRQKTRVHGLSCHISLAVVCVILRLAVLVELRLVTNTDTDAEIERRTDTGQWMHSVTVIPPTQGSRKNTV